MEEQPIFIAPTAQPGEVRLYGNRIEIDRRGLTGTYTRTVYLWNVAFLGYSGGKDLDIVAPNHTSTGSNSSARMMPAPSSIASTSSSADSS